MAPSLDLEITKISNREENQLPPSPSFPTFFNKLVNDDDQDDDDDENDDDEKENENENDGDGDGDSAFPPLTLLIFEGRRSQYLELPAKFPTVVPIPNQFNLKGVRFFPEVYNPLGRLRQSSVASLLALELQNISGWTFSIRYNLAPAVFAQTPVPQQVLAQTPVSTITIEKSAAKLDLKESGSNLEPQKFPPHLHLKDQSRVLLKRKSSEPLTGSNELLKGADTKPGPVPSSTAASEGSHSNDLNVFFCRLPDFPSLKSLGIKVKSTMTPNKVPKPGPAKLTSRAGLDEWLEEAKLCKYLPESAMKQLCEMVKECLMEESNIQPVSAPVTICGDIHGQFYDLLELFRVAGGMPGETNVQPPTTKTTTISAADLEPPTEITDPALKKKIRSSDSGLESADDDDDDDEPRGRPRTAGAESVNRAHEGDDSGVAVNQVSGSGSQNFIFLGDFVDRGYFSLETFTLLMCLKAKYPDKITLVRGNHESRQITQVYGFYEECQQKYGNASVWKSCCQVFDFLILAAIVDGKVLCVHGGLSPEIRTLDQIRVVARAQEIPHEGAFCDLVWSDPEDIETWAVSPRGAGWLFGYKVAKEFNHVNNLTLIARAHQLVNEGYKFHFQEKSVVTVWSAPNYCYRCGNVASIMNVADDLAPKFSIFSAVPEDQRAVPAGRRGAGDYFL